MAVLVASGATRGLRAVGGGGLTATGAYDQIVWLLKQSFGAEHAAIFTRPSARLGGIDWFADFDTDARPVRLDEAEPELRDKALAQLCAAVADIEAKAAALLKSDRQDERVFGDILTRALEVPDDKAIFQIGGQPLLTFWGYMRDTGPRIENPLQTVIRGWRPPKANEQETPPPISTPPSIAPPSPTASEAIAPHPAEAPAASASEGMPALQADDKRAARSLLNSPWALLITIFVLLLLLLEGIVLVRGWSSDHIWAPPLASVPPSTPPSPPSVSIPAQPASPPPVAPSRVSLDILKGCWRSDREEDVVTDGKATGKHTSITLCFDAGGSGSSKIRERESGLVCSGPLRARIDGGRLVIDLDEMVCPGSSTFSAGQIACTLASNTKARCDTIWAGSPQSAGFPFSKIEKP